MTGTKYNRSERKSGMNRTKSCKRSQKNIRAKNRPESGQSREVGLEKVGDIIFLSKNSKSKSLTGDRLCIKHSGHLQG